jgi:SnoaL-like domain
VASKDVDAITALVHEYAYRLDAGDLDGVGALFAHAELGSSVRPERMRGADEARSYYGGVIIYDDGTPRTMHCITNVTVAVDAGATTASARSYFTVLQNVDNFPLQPIIAGQYHDRFERADGSWRFAERIIHPDLYGDLSRHMRGNWLPR